MLPILTQAAQEILQKHYSIAEASITWSRPQESAHGDTSTPVALQIAKQAGAAPQEIAKTLVDGMADLDGVEKVEVAGPGYVNVWLSTGVLVGQLGAVLEACQPKKPEGKPVIVEYSQPNIAKPLGAHHLLTTVFGQSIANLYAFTGYNVIRWNYMGDWGTQFGKLAVAVELWGTDKSADQYSVDELLELYVRFHEEVENDDTLEDKAREAFRKLEEGDSELHRFWEAVVTVTKGALGHVYERLHVEFDTDLSESFYQDKMEPVLQEGQDKGVFMEGKEGSLIVEFAEETNMPPYLVRKGDGATLYSTRDIAQMRYRTDTHDPEKILIITDIAQKLHFEQLAETCAMLQWELPYFENVLVGRMRFADKSMSTRKGNVLKLEELLNEAVERADKKIAEHGENVQTDDADSLSEMMGVGAVAYSIVSQNRKMDIVFDWDKALSFEGNSAPYIQYTHARAQSILRKAEVEIPAVPAETDGLTERERNLLNALLQFEGVLQEACQTHMPHHLCTYLFSLCQDYNTFYNAERIVDAEEPARSLRLYLTHLTATVLRTGAELLTLRVPDRM